MIIPCIDLMGGKVVQLVQGREKALEGGSPLEMIERFAAFPEIQVIDLDAAMGRGSNEGIVKQLTARARLRIGGGVRSVDRAIDLLDRGAYRIIVGTAALGHDGPNFAFLEQLRDAVGSDRLTVALDSKEGQIVIEGWKQAIRWSAAEMVSELEPYCGGFLCTYVDKEGMMQGTDLAWFESLRARTGHELIAAGGITTLDDIRALTAMNIHCAIGMSIYTGRLALDQLRAFNAVTR